MIYLMDLWWNGYQSESESSAESWSFDVFVDMFLNHGFLDSLSDTERGISRRVKISGAGMQDSLLSSPTLNLIKLCCGILTSLFLSGSEMLTMWPKEGTTLMLMLLHERTCTRQLKWSSGMTLDQFNKIIINIKINYIDGYISCEPLFNELDEYHWGFGNAFA